MWRAKSLMADDLKKSLSARLPKRFYGGEQSENIEAASRYQNSKYAEMCQLNKSLISYKDVSLPDRIYGGRNTAPEVFVENNEPLHIKVT